ncbi:MAG: gamma-glutamyltransferase [Desulfurococcales archaeon]|nr:gamma-glutamyltransferase [Desulfurococcales archaeon]
MPAVTIKTKNGGAASESPLASKIGADLLGKGGNAVDAAVAVSYAITVTLPHLGGIGGDFYAMVIEPGRSVRVINGSGPSPAGLKREVLVDKVYGKMPETGGLSVTTPGLVDSTWLLWREFGTLEWNELIAPSTHMALEGFPAPATLVNSITKLTEKLGRCNGTWRTYHDITTPGMTVKFNGLAKLLSMIEEDHRVFYEGDPAGKIVEAVNECGGVFSPDDLASYRAYITEPVSLRYGDWTIWEMPPNTQGLTTLLILKLLESTPPRIDQSTINKLLQAYRIAYYIRDNYIGEPDYMQHKPMELLQDSFITKAIQEAACQRKTKGKDTTFFITADNEGRIVLGIQSLFHHFGSLVTEPHYQIPLNSRAACFTLKPGVPNTVGPRKLPLHTLSTVLIEGRDRIIGYGLSAGHYRPQFHAQIAKRIIEGGEDVVEALQAPRLAWVPWTNKIIVDEELVSKLEGLQGYEVITGRTGVGSIVEVYNGEIRLATDRRGEGIPIVARP